MLLNRTFAALMTAAAVAPMLLLVGCNEGNEAERAVKNVSGVEEGTETTTRNVNENEYIVKDTREIIDADTGEIVGEKSTTTGVTVQEEIKVEREVNVESGTPNTQQRGFVPDTPSTLNDDQ